MIKQERATELIKSLENFSSKAYIDATGSVLTIGYGLAFKYIDGITIQPNDTCTELQAEIWLQESLNRDVFPFVNELQERYQFNDDIYVAISSLVYNIGKNRLGPFFYKSLSINQEVGKPDLIATAFRMYNKIRKNGVLVVCEGLVNRREKEIAVFIFVNM